MLKNFLKISNPKEHFLRDRLGLVKEIVKATLIRFPFQNVTSFGKFLPLERPTPTFRDVISGSIKGEGGLCGHLNNFMKYQLESLGYEVGYVSGGFRRTGVPDSHFLVKVTIPGYASKDPSISPMGERKDKTYIVDVGCGVPLEEPICIDDLPFVRRAGGLVYKYERIDDMKLRRVNENGDALVGPKPPTFVSPQDYTIDLNPKVYSDFIDKVHAVYSNPYTTYLHVGLYCFRYLEIRGDDFEAVCIRGKELIFITKETRTTQQFSGYKDVEPLVLKYFPMLNPDEVRLTTKHFDIPLEEAMKMSSKS